jgi:hypothetical protein
VQTIVLPWKPPGLSCAVSLSARRPLAYLLTLPDCLATASLAAVEPDHLTTNGRRSEASYLLSRPEDIDLK